MPEQPIFELSRLTEYSDQSIVAEVHRVSDLWPTGPLTKARFLAHNKVGMSTVRRHFGSWQQLLKKAGLEDRYGDSVRTRGSHLSARLSNSDMLDGLRNLASSLGRSELTKADINEHLDFSDQALRRRWGSLRSAIEAAGLTVVPSGRRYTDQECFENMLAVWTHFGRQPRHHEMSKPPSSVGPKAYIRRFGTWTKALTAFLERVNQDKDQDTNSTERAVAETAVPGRLAAQDRPSEERRDIPLGLRFRIFRRDRFKCVLCGRHPALNPECVLHMDHIQPWSHGGLTREDNLRTLCDQCNLGRGNRFTD